jgi:predicted  nucleic acid-binding Zn-ribbon protein
MFPDAKEVKNMKEEEEIVFGCPRCGARLLNFSPSGNGRAACDSCQTWWEETPEEIGVALPAEGDERS